MSEPRTYRFRFPLPVNRGNARLHWRRLHAAKKAYWSECDRRAVLELRFPISRPKPPLAKARAEIVVYTANPMDDDNVTARCKWPIDWLVSRGYLVDDGPDHLRLERVTQERSKRVDARVEITLTAVEAA